MKAIPLIRNKRILRSPRRSYMLDIGQGDAILLKVGDEYSMIDTGDIEHRENIVAQLKAWGVTKLKKYYNYASSCRSHGWFLCHCQSNAY